MRGYWALGALCFLASASCVLADQVLERIEINTTADKAWAAIGNFCGIKNWHPAVASCELENEITADVRILTMKDGAKFIEQAVFWSNQSRAYSYRNLASPLPVENYTATIRVLPIDRSKVNIIWMSAFKPIGPAATAKSLLSEFYSAGLKTLKTILESQ